MQASCAFASLAGAPADLTLVAAESVVQFLAAHIGNLQNEAAATAVAPLPNGDPFEYAAHQPGDNSVMFGPSLIFNVSLCFTEVEALALSLAECPRHYTRIIGLATIGKLRAGALRRG